ncbi:MAG TPA: hypothetical protein P5337_04595 [Aestuariivirga sp.]|nr:hypothetical protein [Aestuariivirga sp.]
MFNTANNSITSTIIGKYALGMALAIAACTGFSLTMAGPAAAAQVIQKISATSAAGTGSMTQRITRNTQAASLTRVCVINRSDRTKTFTHAQPNINALRAAPGGKSCANFPSNARVHFALFDDGQPVTAGVSMVMSLSAFAGGRVDFVWRDNE